MMPEVGIAEFPGVAVLAHQPVQSAAGGTDPDDARLVLVDGGDDLMAQTLRLVRDGGIVPEFMLPVVKLVESPPAGADPYQPGAVLEQGGDGVVAQALQVGGIILQIADRWVSSLRRAACRGQGEIIQSAVFGTDPQVLPAVVQQGRHFAATQIEAVSPGGIGRREVADDLAAQAIQLVQPFRGSDDP